MQLSSNSTDPFHLPCFMAGAPGFGGIDDQQSTFEDAGMTRIRMHADEVFTDVALVRRLLAAQFPHWTDLPIEPVPSSGTDHDIYRLGAELCVRLPRIGWATGQAAREAQWLPRLAPHLPLRLPVPVAMGQPEEAYPFGWSVYEWLPGDNAQGRLEDLEHLEQAAVDLAAFVAATAGWAAASPR